MPFPRLVGRAALALSLAACSSTPDSLSDADRGQIKAASDAWRLANSRRDVSSVGALYARDAILLPPNAPVVRGRADIEGFFGAMPNFTNFDVVLLEIEGDGSVAWVWGAYSMQLALPGIASPVPERGKFLEIWRKQEDGSWRIERDMFSSDLPGT